MRLVDPSQVGKLMKYYGFSAPDMTITEFVEDELTDISAVPVVRCRECVHNHPEFVGNEAEWCELCRTTVNPDDFCSYGQRKEADHEVSE